MNIVKKSDDCLHRKLNCTEMAGTTNSDPTIELVPKKRASYGSILPDSSDSLMTYSTEKNGAPQITDILTINELLDNRRTERRIRYNIWLISIAVFFLYAGMAPTGLIQSSFNAKGGLGVTSLSVNSAFMISGSIIAVFIIPKLGCKSSLIVGSFLYILYIPANFYPTWFTMIPAAVLSGIGKPINDVAYKVYLAKLGHLYSELTATDLDRINSRIFAIGMIITQAGVAVGNLASSFILSSDSNNKFDRSNYPLCGVNYCNEELKVSHLIDYNATFSNENLSSEEWGIYLLIAICTLSGLIGIAIFSFQDSLKVFGISSNTDQCYTSSMAYGKEFMLITFDPKYILLIPLILVLYGADAFWVADFNKAFVTCSIGMDYLGYVAVWGGLTAILGGLLLGWFNNSSIRCFPLTCATILQMITMMAMFYWKPSSPMANFWTLSTFTIIFTFASSARYFMTPVLIAVVFKENLETAFSVYHMWGYIANTVFFALSNLLCVSTKMYILIVIIPVSFITYIVVEMLLHRQNNSTNGPYFNFNDEESDQS